MSKMISFLQQPAPVNRKPWMVVCVASLLVFFLLAIFQPFGLANLKAGFKWLAIGGFALVTALATSMVGLVFPRFFPTFYAPSHWTIGKSLINNLILLFIIGLGNFVWDWSLTNRAPHTFLSVGLSYLFITVLVGLIPSVVSMFIIQNAVLKQHLKEAQAMNKGLMQRLNHTEMMHPKETDPLLLSGNTKDCVELYPEDILYLEVSGNYVKINYRQGDVCKQKQLRATIGQMEKALEAFPYIVRCHRAFMVNIRQVINVEGNSQGFQLSLSCLKEEVPVSRTYTTLIREKMNQIR
ncbi:LytTR family transcriptional regulator [Parabacteroides sp. 52]|uniref:LytR/AlgR family response regulator transcription factor n=1 Tax=unclassified Parabacteroides TaxID=2649774 RepID=UPI0013D28F8A|nr:MULTISPECIES: LytTR family DNA-binding domain-containing protein [unclassified Parabacteroides]MDH6533869.1 hypothetical protein [Parabacteroides sp. PM5-20]NDV54614.1 LytTR family transcriptional regulator [Parabacteroides sp. 52]